MSSALFPQAYTTWLKTRIGGSRPESLATCDNCAMVKPTGVTRDKGPFLNHLKCCTYFPYIPNFSLGALPEEKVNVPGTRGILLPVGLFPSQEEQNLIEHHGMGGFGKVEALLCPYFEKTQNKCSIWENRPGVCTTYFCKSEKGKKGLAFWKDVETYLNEFEWKLACEVLSKMGMGENEIAYCQGAISIETELDEREYFIQAAWGKWSNKKYEFFQKTRDFAMKITSERLDQISTEGFLALQQKINDATLY